MKIRVDYDLCEANAICMEQAPEVFKVDEKDSPNTLSQPGLQYSHDSHFHELHRASAPHTPTGLRGRKNNAQSFTKLSR